MHDPLLMGEPTKRKTPVQDWMLANPSLVIVLIGVGAPVVILAVFIAWCIAFGGKS